MAGKALVVIAALAVLTWPAGVAGQGVTATVLSIGDGDTIRVRQAGAPSPCGWPATAKAVPSRKPDG